jgi:hypothetical protein
LMLRPFEYGNTPAAMVFIEQLARVAGHSLDLFAEDRLGLNAALRDALTLGNMRSLERTILDGIKVSPAHTSTREAAERGNVSSDSTSEPTHSSHHKPREGAALNRRVPVPASRDDARATGAAMRASLGRSRQPRNLPNHVR